MAGPASAAPEAAKASMWASLPAIMAYWGAAIGVILMNADILRKVHNPAALTAWHQLCCTVLVNVLWWVAPGLFDSKAPRLSAKQILTQVAPVGVLLALTLGVGNRAYIYLSVAFIQMVKASHPVLAYLISCLVGSEAFRHNKLQATLIVTVGVMLSVSGELHFNLLGFAFQMFGSLAECLRVVLIGLLLSQQGLKLDPLSTVSYVAPIAFLVLLPMALLTERPADWSVWWGIVGEQVGYSYLVFNGLLAFALNLAVVTLISRTDPVVYVAVGVLKDILTVVISAAAFSEPVTGMQTAGYLTALAGVQIYNLVQTRPQDFEKGVYCGLFTSLMSALGLSFSPAASEGLLQNRGHSYNSTEQQKRSPGKGNPRLPPVPEGVEADASPAALEAGEGTSTATGSH